MELHRSPHTKFSTAVGKEGWLYIWEIDDIEKKINGEILMSPVEASNAIRNIELRNAWCKSRNIHYLHLIAPDKASIYPHYLPDAVKIPDVNLIQQYRSEFHDKKSYINFVDVVGALRNRSEQEQVYFKTDAHWNYHGAMLVLDMLIDNINLTGLGLPKYDAAQCSIRSVKRIQELGALMPDPVTEEFDVIMPRTKAATQTFVSDSARGKIQIFTNENENLPRAVIFRDSFSSFFLPHLVERFSKTMVLNSRVFWYDLVEKFRADVVIVEVAERYLYPVVLDVNNKGFESFFGVSEDFLLSRA